MSREVPYERYEGQEAARLDVFLPAYQEVYAEPPYGEGPDDIADFIETHRTQAWRPGVSPVLARDGDEVAGFAFGYLLPAGTRWWSNLQEPLPEDFTREDGTRTYVVIELAVRRAWRRLGIAAGLHARLLDGAGRGAGRAHRTARAGGRPGTVVLRGLGIPEGRRLPPVGGGAVPRRYGPPAPSLRRVTAAPSRCAAVVGVPVCGVGAMSAPWGLAASPGMRAEVLSSPVPAGAHTCRTPW